MNNHTLKMKSAGTAAGLELDEKELELINRHTMRQFAAAELFAFKVTICDNEIDRDGEAFSEKALKNMVKLFLGKTVIANHDYRAQNQCARIYSTGIIKDEHKTSYGNEYIRLEARCYIPRTNETKALIGSVEAGIMKEVSIGFTSSKAKCSICGNPYYSGECTHQSVKLYENDEICYALIDEVTDAYELSFVPVPAQPAAGVTKSANMDGGDFEISLFSALESLNDTAECLSILRKMFAEAEKFEKNQLKKVPAPALQAELHDSETDMLIKNAKLQTYSSLTFYRLYPQ